MSQKLLAYVLMLFIATVIAQDGTGLPQREQVHSSRALRTNYVFIIDVSKSMVGYNGAPVIFPAVKDRILNLIEQVPDGSNIFFFPFDSIVHNTFRAENISYDRNSIRTYVGNLEAEGWKTHIYTTLADVVDSIRSFMQVRTDKYEFTNVIYLLTDGHDTGPKEWTLEKALEFFMTLKIEGRDLKRENDWLYYMTLGVSLDESELSTLQKHGDFVTHINSPKDTVLFPIRVIPVFRHLKFDNIWNNKSKRTICREYFRVEGPTDRIPRINAKLFIETPDNAQYSFFVEPEQFGATRTEPVILEIGYNTTTDGVELDQQRYFGRIVLSPDRTSDLISITPNELTIEIPHCPSGVSVDFNDDGKLTKSVQADTIDVRTYRGTKLEISVVVRVNGANCVENGEVLLKANLSPTSKNDLSVRYRSTLADSVVIPDSAFDGTFSYEDILQVNWQQDAVPVDFTVALELKSAEYKVSPTQATFGGTLIRTSAPWVLPAMILACILAVLSAAVIAGSVLTGSPGRAWHQFACWTGLRHPILSGSIEYIGSDSDRRQQTISGKERIRVGSGAPVWADLPVSLILFAECRKGKNTPVLKVLSGDCALRRSGRGKELTQAGKKYVIGYDDFVLVGHEGRIRLKS